VTACRFLSGADFAGLDQPGLHELIDRVQLHITAVHDTIAATYFPQRPDAGQRQSQLILEAPGSLALFN
jgi:hypothetical protein